MTGGDWREGGFRQRPPSAQTLAWVAESLGPRCRVVDCRGLTGGVSSAVHRVSVEVDGERRTVLLRQYPPDLDLDEAIKHEVANLELVAGSGIPVPSVLHAEVSGAATGGAPSLLMSLLPGDVDLNPTDCGAWITRIAELGAVLHSLDLPAPSFDAWSDSWIAPVDELRVPNDAQKPWVWRAAFERMRSTPPTADDAFLHGDFLPVNMLWSKGRITGLLDWNGVHRGPRALDVGHCRRYLAALYSPEIAEQLRASYESISGHTLDPWWDLFALLHHDDNQAGWIRQQVAGRRSFDAVGVTSRIELVVEEALDRVG